MGLVRYEFAPLSSQSFFIFTLSLISKSPSPFILWLAMTPSLSQGRSCGKSPCVYSHRSLAQEKDDSKINMCLELFNILDGILCEFILMFYVKLQKQDN